MAFVIEAAGFPSPSIFTIANFTHPSSYKFAISMAPSVAAMNASPEEDNQRPKRTRKSAPKSRQGCAKCKSRRIKCDENRPACKNCTRLGHICPGFQQLLRWSDKHEQHQAPVPCPDQPPPEAPAAADSCQRSSSTETEVADSWETYNVSRNIFDCFVIDRELIATQTPPLCTTTELCYRATAPLSHVPEWTPAAAFEGSESLRHLLSSALTKPLIHMPTALVEHWFRYICPTRSTFDSETNYNRLLACNTWSTSEAVFYTLQAMSAAYSMPHLSKDLRAQAVAAVDQGITRIRSVQTTMVTVDLVFAVFKLGTSLSGTPDTGEHSWSELAHELLTAWGMQLSVADVLVHAYFCQAFTYWEMVLAAIGGGFIPHRVDRKRLKYEDTARRETQSFDSDFSSPGPEPFAYNPGLNLLGTRPNSWCGISNEVIDLFGQVLALCHTKVRGNPSSTADALYDTYLAHEFQRELLAMDFDTLVLMDEANGYFIETRDDKTPISHLLQTAEAYRQAALLQLHLAFDHLITDTTPRAGFLLRLVLCLLETLEQIPLDSGSRTIHPMLYLSAAAALRHLESSEPCAFQLEISRAKRLVSSRLELLPNHASGGTLQFVKSVWRQYEADRSWVNWRDVLEDLGSGLHL